MIKSDKEEDVEVQNIETLRSLSSVHKHMAMSQNPT